MTQAEFETFISEYFESMKTSMLENVPHFPQEWNGLHVRAILALGADLKKQPDCVKRAAREVSRSECSPRLQFPG